MPPATTATLYFHLVFFTALGCSELLAPSTACRQGLAGPLTSAGVTVEDMCVAIEGNPAAQLILFGLAKYHLLFAVITAFTLWGLGSVAPDVQEKLRGAALLLHGLNFLCDDTWALLHLQWIGAGPVALIPQGLLIAWNVYLAIRPAPKSKQT